MHACPGLSTPIHLGSSSSPECNSVAMCVATSNNPSNAGAQKNGAKGPAFLALKAPDARELELGAYPAQYAVQRRTQLGGLRTAGHGHVGFAAALTAHLRGNVVGQFAGLDLAR